MNLDELISFWEDLATAPTLSKRNTMVLKRTIEELQGKKHLLQKISDEMLPGKKFCYRYGHPVVEQCDICEACPGPDDLQWNEGD